MHSSKTHCSADDTQHVYDCVVWYEWQTKGGTHQSPIVT